MRTPVIVITGVDRAAMDTVMMGLLWDIPAAVAVQHSIDPVEQILTRLVSDASGVVDRERLPLEHACISCALREDILPTLERLARDGRWTTIVSCLPIAAEAEQLGTMITRDPHLARYLRLASVIAATEPQGLAADLLGDDLLRERDLHSSPDDDRGLGETECSLIEYADVIVLSSPPNAPTQDLVHALAQPQAPVIIGAENLDANQLTAERHQHARAIAWRTPVTTAELPALPPGHAWRLDLSSPRPFHPERLVEQVGRLGTGAHRSRGCFWVPTRPSLTAQWDGAGGQLSIGPHSYDHRARLTRLIFTGLGRPPLGLVEAFEDLLVNAEEDHGTARNWRVAEDGLEPWLGDIHQAA